MNSSAASAMAEGRPTSDGHEVRVLCVTPVGESGKGGIDSLYAYLRAAGRPDRSDAVAMRYFASRGGLEGWRWIPAFPVNAARFVVRLARERPHVVHLNFATGGSLWRKYVLALLSRLFGRRVILHFHGRFPEAAIASGRIEGRLFRALTRLGHRVIALGPVVHDRFVRLANVPDANIRVVPNGIRDFAAAPRLERDGPAHLMFAGEVGEYKGVPVLLDALGLIAGRGDWRCTIAGNGDLARYEAQARRLRIDGAVRFTGWLPVTEVHALMRASDIVVLPSQAENLPLALIEGACARAALIATPGGETGSILRDAENGWFVSRNPEDIARALSRLLDDRDMLARMQARSREIFEAHFTIEAFAAKLFAAYRDCAGV